MKKPNFFIIGAAKSGTTALSEYLRTHPKVFFSTPKETGFFGKDFPARSRPLKNLTQYLKLFEQASPKHIAIGEGSVRYLFSKSAVSEILNFNPDAKFIVMLRNPVDMFFSLYNQYCYARQENVSTAKQAWRLQYIRQKNKKMIPPLCVAPQVLNYNEQCKVGALVERLFSIVPSNKVFVIIYDDFQKNTREVYQNTLKFLNLPDDHKTNFPKINSRRKLINPFLNKLFSMLFFLIHFRYRLGLGQIRCKKLNAWIKNINFNLCYSRQKVEEKDLNFIAELKKHFKEDIAKLSKLLNRDLMHWVE